MRKIKLYIANTIDGYIASKDGDLDWLMEFPNPERNDYGYQSFFETIDIVVMGGRTYRDILNMDVIWPYKDKQSYIITRDKTHHPNIDNIQFISENIIETIFQMRNSKGKDIWLVGGGEIISLFLANDLVDEMIIITIPVTLGDGIPLFRKISKESKWRIIDFQKYNTGVTQVHYMKER